VRTTRSKAAAAARIGAALGRRKRAELLGLLRPCFARTKPWLQAGKYAAAVMSQIPRRNGWTIAAQAGDRTGSGTGAYRGVRGSFPVTLTLNEVGARPCQPSPEAFRAQLVTVAGSGTIWL
jgi:hypothetical protein